MQIKRTDAQHTLMMLRTSIQATRAHNDLNRELGYRCDKTKAVALDLMIKLMR